MYRTVVKFLQELTPATPATPATQDQWTIDAKNGALRCPCPTHRIYIHTCNVLYILLDGEGCTNVPVTGADLSISSDQVSRIYHNRLKPFQSPVDGINAEIHLRMNRVIGERSGRVAIELRPDKTYRLYRDSHNILDVPAYIDRREETEYVPEIRDLHTHLMDLVRHAFCDGPPDQVSIKKTREGLHVLMLRGETPEIIGYFSRFVHLIGGTMITRWHAEVVSIDPSLRPSDFSRFTGRMEFVHQGRHHVEYAMYTTDNQRLVSIRMETEFTVALCFLTNYSTIKRLDRWTDYKDHPNFRTYVHNPRDRTRSQSAWSDRVPNQVLTVYAGIEMVDAEGELYRTARQDPTNFAFVLLSDTSIPLVSPDVLYERLKEIWRVTEEAELLDHFIGIGDIQNQTRNSYLVDFIDDATTDLFGTIPTDTYKIPSLAGTIADPNTAIRSLMPQKVLSVRGADEFIAMVHDTLFMKLFEKQLHYPPDAMLHDLRLSVVNDIIRPASGPDEGTFVMWCNYRSSRLSRPLFFLIVDPGFGYWDFDEVNHEIIRFESIAHPNARGYKNDFNPTKGAVCMDDVWFARKVTKQTLIPYAGNICQRNFRPIRTIEKTVEMISEYVEYFVLVYDMVCTKGTDAISDGRCIVPCTHTNGSVFTEECTKLV